MSSLPRSADSPAPDRRGGGSRRRAGAAISAAAFIALVLLGFVPGIVGTAVAVMLPWLWIPALVLCVAALRVRGRRWIAAVPALTWVLAVSTSITWLPAAITGSPWQTDGNLVVASQNVQASSGTADASARALQQQGADLVALTELDAESREQAIAELAGSHPYSYLVGTVGLWSTLPIAEAHPLDLGLGWRRALAAQVEAPGGPIEVYVIHAASLRPGSQSARDTMLRALGDTIAADAADRVIAIGDFNAAATDPALAAIRAQLDEPRQEAGGFGFTWPAGVPLARIDHVYQRGFVDSSAKTLRAGESDHLAILAALG